MSTETLEIDDEVTPALIAMAAKAQLASSQVESLRSKIGGLVAGGVADLVNEFGSAAGKAAELAVQTTAVAQAEKHVTSEVQRQIQLQTQIATFDANRVRQTKALEAELAHMHDQALGGEGARAQAAAAEAKARSAAAKEAGEMAGGIMMAYDAAKQLASALWDGAKAMASITFDGAKLAVEMSNFRGESLRVFENFTGSSAAAEQMLSRVKALANVTGEAPEAVAGRMKKLLAEGFSPALADDILTAQADVLAALGEGEASKLEGIFEKLHNKGALDQKTITGLARAGVDTQRVYESLATHLHKSVDQVKADLKTGAIAGDEAAAAIADAVEGKFGGSAQKRADNDIFIMLARIKNDARGLFENVDIGPIKDAAKSLIEALEGPGGKELAGGLTDMFGAIFHALFDPFKGPEGVAKLQLVMHEAAQALHNVADAARSAAPYIRMAVDTIAALSQGDKGDGGFSGLERIAQAMKVLLDIGKLVISGGLLGGFGEIGDDIAKLFDIQVPDLTGIGSNMIDGLVDGITGGASRVVDALVGAVTGAVKAAESVLGINSPSRVFHEIGTMTSQGFANGIAANDGAPRAASASMASGAAAVAAPTVGGAAGAAGGGQVQVIVNSPITVHADDAEGGAEAGAAAAPGIQQAHREAATSYWRGWKEAG